MKLAKNWHDYSWDLIRKIEQLETPISGIGHSMGGILLLKAAVEKPEYFNELILLDQLFFQEGLFTYLTTLPKFITRKNSSGCFKGAEEEICLNLTKLPLIIFEKKTI